MINRVICSLSLLVLVLFESSNNASVVEAFSLSSRTASRPTAQPYGSRSYLFPVRKNGLEDRKMRLSLDVQKDSKRRKWGINGLKNVTSRYVSKFRRSVALICTVCLLWFGSAGVTTSPAQAASAAATLSSTMSKLAPSNLFSRPIDKIVDSYVKDHMFADDLYDQLESSYREAVDDNTRGTYPKALSEVTSLVLGQDGYKANKEVAGSGFGHSLTTMIGWLRNKGLSESTAIIVLATTFVVAGPLAFLTVGMIVGGASKRQMRKVMRQRYGDTYSVDASIKVEKDVELPDEDEEEDDDDEEKNDDDDDDDDEDD